MTDFERITVNLTPRSATALDTAAHRTGLNKTETINRALQLYDHLDEIQHNGGALYVRETKDAKTLERVRLF